MGWGGGGLAGLYLFNSFILVHALQIYKHPVPTMLTLSPSPQRREKNQKAKKKNTQNRTKALLYYPHTSLPYASSVLQAHTCNSHNVGRTHAAGLTADGEERVGLLARHRGHTLQRVETSAAHVDPALHLRLAEARAKERDGDDVELLLGGVHLL